MALTTPILAPMNAFDAVSEQLFTFNVIGGDQCVANTLTIKDNETLEVVYTNRKVTFAFENTVPSGTLINGKYYQASIVTENSAGAKSAQSNIVQFYCYTQPTFVFSNIASTGIISNASYSFEVTYNQTENETLDSYVFNLYNSQKILLSTSGNQYNSSSTLPLTISHLFEGLMNNAEYYVEANGITSGGTKISTGLVNIFVQYAQPAFYSSLILTNHCQGGYITVQANVAGIEGKSNPSPPIYVEEKAVDLTKTDTYVKWDDGFEIDGNFTFRIWFKSAWIDNAKYPISKAIEYLNKAKVTEKIELFNLTNPDGQIIRGGIWYEQQDFLLTIHSYLSVQNHENDIHGYIIDGDAYFGDAEIENITDTRYVLIVKRINNLYESSVKKSEETI